MSTIECPFVHHHSIMLPVGKGDMRPSINNIIVKPLSALITHPQCPQTFKTLHSMAPQSNIIIGTASQDGWFSIISALHDSRTDKLTYDGHMLQHTKKIEALCEDPLNAHIVFSCANDGSIFEWDLFTKQHRAVLTKSNNQFQSIACNQYHLVATTDGKIYIFDRNTGQTITIDREMHGNCEILYACFHPIHSSYLFTADANGMINVFNLAGSAETTQLSCDPKLKAVQIGHPILIHGFDLSETYVGTIQITDSAHSFHFFGPDCRFIAIISATTQSLTLVEFDVKNDSGETEVMTNTLGHTLNEALIQILGCNRETFFEEYTDIFAEENLAKRGILGVEINGEEVVDPIIYAHLTRTMDDEDSQHLEDHTENGSTSTLFDDENMIPVVSQVSSSAEMLNALFVPTTEEERDPAHHPRLWRVTHLVQVQLLPDFYQAIMNPATAAQFTGIMQLFVFAATVGGGLLCATVSANPNAQQLTITNIFPVAKPYTAHTAPLLEVRCVLPSFADGSGILHPIIFTGGRDGKLAIFNTFTDHHRIKENNPAVFNQLSSDILNLGQKIKSGRTTEVNSETGKNSLFSNDLHEKPKSIKSRQIPKNKK